MSGWVRPLNIPYPNVWRKFTRTTADGRVRSFRIQDAGPDMLDEIYDLFKNYFMEEEPLNQVFGMLHDEVSLKEMYVYWASELQRKTIIVCFEENTESGKDVLVSCNVMGVRTKGNILRVQATGRALVSMNIVLGHIMLDVANVYETFNVDKYLSAYGLCVHGNYRGIGIGVQMLLVREEYCKAIEVPFTVTQFTSKGGQSTGAKAGFILHVTKKYTDIEKDTGVNLTGIKHDCVKVMYKRFD